MENNEKVLKIACELADAIKESETFAAYERAKAASDADANLQRMIGEFNLKRLAVSNEMDKDEPDEALVTSINDDMRTLYDSIMSNENMKFYNIRKSYVDELLNSVNSTIMSAITGEPQNCTHDCSTCGGCH